MAPCHSYVIGSIPVTILKLLGRRVKRWCWLLPNEQGGGNLTFMFGISLALLALTPFLLDIANTYHARVVGQTGADAAALAAARELADALGRDGPSATDGVWHESEHEAEERAKDAAEASYIGAIYNQVVGNAGEAAARSWAQELAQRNGGRLTGPARLVSRAANGTVIRRYFVNDVQVDTRVEREVTLIMQDLYGDKRDAPAEATAVVYLIWDDFDHERTDTRQRCMYFSKKENRCTAWRTEYMAHYHLKTKWEVELIR